MKRKNTSYMETIGVISDLMVRGLDFPTSITVQYAVNGQTYELHDTIKLKNEKIKLGFLTVGQKRVPALGDTHVGSELRVCFNPDDPGDAYLPDNLGKGNI